MSQFPRGSTGPPPDPVVVPDLPELPEATISRLPEYLRALHQ
ncbi:MAG: redox-sensing transcriptional repressor Rex, partial [Natronosporangium sp.]